MGGRPPRVPDSDFLAVFQRLQDSEDNPVLSASEVADELPMKYEGTKTRLDDLVDDGELRTKKVGSGRAYWDPNQ